MKNTKRGQVMTGEEKRNDIIFGIKKYLEVGMFDKVYLLEKELINNYGMTPNEIESAIYE